MAGNYSFLLKSSVAVLGLFVAVGFGAGHALAKDKGKEVMKSGEQMRNAGDAKAMEADEAKWEEQAERSFGVGRGVGKKLMTREEWREHQMKMQSMTPEEREAYRKEVHQKLRERAKERGIAMPDTPGPHGQDGKRKMKKDSKEKMDRKDRDRDHKDKMNHEDKDHKDMDHKDMDRDHKDKMNHEDKDRNGMMNNAPAPGK